MNFRPLAALPAAALLAAMNVAPAFADSVNPSVTQSSSNQTVNNGPGPGVPGDQTSSIGGGAAQGSSGNIGLNASAGALNAQTNAVIFEGATTPVTGGGVSTTAGVSQTVTNSGTGPGSIFTNNLSSNNTSTLGDTTATGPVPNGSPQGNFGANSSAGALNEQANLLVISNKPVATSATETSTQTVNGGTTPTVTFGNQTSTLTGTMGQGSTGNVGFNTAAGAKNLQANALELFTTGAPGNSATATQTLNQSVAPYNGNGDSVSGAGGYSSSVDGTALNGVSGNAGANSAAGVANIQANSTLVTGSTPLSSQQQTGNQSIANASSITIPAAASYRSSVSSGGGAASGNLGINSAAGTQNLQGNALLVGDPPGTGVTQGFNQTATDATASSVQGSTASSQLTGNSGQNFGGNLGIHSAAGMQNEQLNLASVVNGDAAGVSQTLNQQLSGVQGTMSGQNGSTPLGSSTVGGNTANGAVGNVGITSAAGVQNLQSNGIVVVNGGATSAVQSFNPTIGLDSNGNPTTAAIATQTVGLSSQIGGNAAYGTNGNVGIDSAAGAQNLQANGLVIVSGASTSPATTQQMPDAAHAAPTIDRAQFTIQGSLNSALNGSAGGGLASGHLGFNTAAGVQNVQNNGLAIYSGSASGPQSGQNSTQSTTTTGIAGGASLSGTTSASISGSAGLQSPGATGVIGFNSAAGAQNIQSNAASIFMPGASGTPSASLQSQQTVKGAAQVQTNGTFSSTLGGSAGQGDTGVAGLNVAAGVGNQQMGLATVVNDSGAASPAAGYSPTMKTGQTATNVVSVSSTTGSSVIGDASTGGGVFLGASGVMSANSAAGTYNQQANAMLMTSGNLADVAPQTVQQNSGLHAGPGAPAGNTPNISTIGASAFNGANGVMGANSASGVTNQQVNNVIVRQ